MSAFDDLAGMPPLPTMEGVLARTVEGGSLTLAVFELDPSAVIPEHAHPNEQLGMVLTGSVAFRVGAESRVLGPGETWRIPPSVPHEATAGPEGAVVIDVFSPPRDDWGALERAEPRSPRWP
jgi:quercetin dioxygenase-like cupin family protein